MSRPFDRVVSWLRRAQAPAVGSSRVNAMRLLWKSGRGWFGAVGLFMLAEALLPAGAVVAMGSVVSRIPPAARAHLHGAAGARLLHALILASILLVLSLLTGPCQEVLGACVKPRIVDALQVRLMRAVSGPPGIGHLEDPAVLDRLALAQGQLTNFDPGDAPVLLAGIIGTRLGGLAACVVIATFRWWLGLGLFALWTAVRRPLRTVIVTQVMSFRGQAEVMRRAWYFMQLSSRPVAAKELRVFGLGDWSVARYRSNWLQGMAVSWASLAKVTRQVVWLSGAVLAVYVAALGFLGYAAQHHEITLGTFAVILPMLPLTMNAGSITFADISLEWMLSSLPDVDDLEAALAERAVELRGTRLARGLPERSVVFDDVSFVYPGGSASVLDHLDLILQAGTSTAIVGQNGAGKTTLVKLLGRFYDPTGGVIRVDGHDLSSLQPDAWQRQLAVVFQDFSRYPLSAAENVGLGSFENLDDTTSMARVAERVGLGEVIGSLPRGWDTVLSAQFPDGVDLSGGQWQRVALARALFAVEHGARILILDEPTSWLDARSEADFFDRFFDLTRGVTSIVISHRFSTVRRADQICVLEGGRVAEFGNHDELMAVRGRYAAMFEAQASRFAGPDVAR